MRSGTSQQQNKFGSEKPPQQASLYLKKKNVEKQGNFEFFYLGIYFGGL